MVLLAHRGEGVDHTTAAANFVALIETVADKPGRRILHSADPDALSALKISRTIAQHFNHPWDEVLLDDDAPPALGQYPWDKRPPVVLDTTASSDLGYRPAGDYASTVIAELDWLVSAASRRDGNELPSAYFTPMLDDAAEDHYLAGRLG